MLDERLLPLHDERVRLRALRHDDAAAFAEGSSDAAVKEFGHLPEPEYTARSVSTMIDAVAGPALRRGDLAVLAIADRETDRFAGSLVMFDVTARTAEVGFWLRPEHRGGGLANAALELAVRFARDSGLTSLSARTDVANRGSQRTLSRSGFVEMGRNRDLAPSGSAIDVVHFRRDVRDAAVVPASARA